MLKTLILLTTLSLIVSGCGKLGPELKNPFKNTRTVQPEDPTQPPSNNPKPPKQGDGDPLPNSVCYLKTSGQQACFTVYDRAEVHRAEPKYSYIDSFNDPKFPSGLDPWQYRSPINLLFHPEHEASTPLAPNFIRKEMLNANSTRGHYGFFSPDVLRRIQNIRSILDSPMIINSAYRSPGYNQTLPGAATFSRHTYGDAIDFKVPGKSFQQIAALCLENGASFYQIYSNHIHCDWRNTALNTQIFGQPLRESKAPSETFENVKLALESHAQIVVSSSQLQSSSSQKTINLYVDSFDSEDGGDLIFDWKIFKNGQEIWASLLENPWVTLDTGRYQVIVKIGGSLTKELDLVIP